LSPRRDSRGKAGLAGVNSFLHPSNDIFATTKETPKQVKILIAVSSLPAKLINLQNKKAPSYFEESAFKNQTNPKQRLELPLLEIK
jgi:hypothetical protein